MPKIRIAFPEDVLVLDIGCGTEVGKELRRTEHTQNIIGLDIRDTLAADVIADMTRGLPFRNESFDIVFASHILEHFPKNEIGVQVNEWIRVLKRSGELWVFVPNLKWIAEAILRGKDITKGASVDKITVMHQIYGANEHPYDLHKWGFTLETLTQFMISHNLEIIQAKESGGEADLEHKPEILVKGRK